MFLQLLLKFLSRLPFGVLYALSDGLYYPLYYVVRYRRSIVRRNLTESFPEKSRDEIVQIEKRFYHFFIDMVLETCKLLTISPEEMKRRMTFSHTEEINEVGAEGRSVAVFLGHYGNWEWISSMGMWLNKEAVVAQIYHKLSNKAVDSLIKELRERMGGHKCVEMRSTARYMNNALKTGKPHFIGFIADQAPRKRDSKYYLHFLNHYVPVLTGTEKLVKHYDYAAVFLAIKRIRRGFYECKVIPLHKNPQSLPDFELTDLYYQKLEQEIKAMPELYLWTHNRFRGAINAKEERPN